MSNDSRTINGTVHVASDSGSPERVAKELCIVISSAEKLGLRSDFRKAYLDLYAECLDATKGYRRVSTS